KPEARMGAQVVPLAGAKFTTDVELPPGGRVVLEMQRADGRRAFIPIGKAAAAPANSPVTTTTDVEGDLDRQRATLFGRQVLLDLLRVDLHAPEQVAPGTPVKFTLTQPLAQPARWTLIVRRDDGEPAWRDSGQGAPPAELMWSADGAAAGGRIYFAQLL